MAKYVSPMALDKALDYISENATHVYILENYPTSFSSAVISKLASVAVTFQDFEKSFTGNNGRKLSVKGKENIVVTRNGRANHLAIVNENTSEILLVTETAQNNLTTSYPAEFRTFDYEIPDAV